MAGYDRTDPATVDVPLEDYSAALDRGVDGLTIGVPTNPNRTYADQWVDMSDWLGKPAGSFGATMNFFLVGNRP